MFFEQSPAAIRARVESRASIAAKRNSFRTPRDALANIYRRDALSEAPTGADLHPFGLPERPSEYDAKASLSGSALIQNYPYIERAIKRRIDWWDTQEKPTYIAPETGNTVINAPGVAPNATNPTGNGETPTGRAYTDAAAMIVTQLSAKAWKEASETAASLLARVRVAFQQLTVKDITNIDDTLGKANSVIDAAPASDAQQQTYTNLTRSYMVNIARVLEQRLVEIGTSDPSRETLTPAEAQALAEARKTALTPATPEQYAAAQQQKKLRQAQEQVMAAQSANARAISDINVDGEKTTERTEPISQPKETNVSLFNDGTTPSFLPTDTDAVQPGSSSGAPAGAPASSGEAPSTPAPGAPATPSSPGARTEARIVPVPSTVQKAVEFATGNGVTVEVINSSTGIRPPATTEPERCEAFTKSNSRCTNAVSTDAFTSGIGYVCKDHNKSASQKTVINTKNDVVPSSLFNLFLIRKVSGALGLPEPGSQIPSGLPGTNNLAGQFEMAAASTSTGAPATPAQAAQANIGPTTPGGTPIVLALTPKKHEGEGKCKYVMTKAGNAGYVCNNQVKKDKRTGNPIASGHCGVHKSYKAQTATEIAAIRASPEAEAWREAGRAPDIDA
jgi:hypothetical protein